MINKKYGLFIAVMLGVSISLISCSGEKEKVLNVNVQSSESFTKDMTVKILNINLDDGEMYLPKYIEDDKIYGLKTLPLISERDWGLSYDRPIEDQVNKNLYELKTDGKLEELDRGLPNYSAGGTGAIKYVSEKDSSNSGDVYLFDNKTGESRVIGKYDNEKENEYYKNYIYKEGDYVTQYNPNTAEIIEGNSDYAYILNSKLPVNKDDKGKLLQLDIVDLKSNETYSYKGDDITSVDRVIYSKRTNEFYGISFRGKVYKITFKNTDVKFEEVYSIDTKGLDSEDRNGFLFKDISLNDNGDILICNRLDSGSLLAAVYNPQSKTVKYVDKSKDEKLRVGRYFDGTNKVILKKITDDKGFETYIGEINDGDLKIYNKIETQYKDKESSVTVSSIISEDKKKILITDNIYEQEETNEGSVLKSSRYEYRLIEFK